MPRSIQQKKSWPKQKVYRFHDFSLFFLFLAAGKFQYYRQSYLICTFRSGRRAMMAREKLEEHGYRMIRVYEGSFDDWKDNGGEVETV